MFTRLPREDESNHKSWHPMLLYILYIEKLKVHSLPNTNEDQ